MPGQFYKYNLGAGRICIMTLVEIKHFVYDQSLFLLDDLVGSFV